MANNNIIPFTEIVARAEKLNQQKSIAELEEKKRKNIEALKYGLENVHFSTEVANLFSLIALTIYADRDIRKLKSSTTTTKPKTKGGATK